MLVKPCLSRSFGDFTIEFTYLGKKFTVNYLSSEEKWNYNNAEQIYLPVFGAVDGNEAMYGIITSGASSSAIGAHAGDSALGYSGVYPICIIL